jgi:hypothetical protein
MATPYVVSSDLVSAYPAKSLEIAQYIDGFKADLALVQNAQTGTTYSFVAADFTKLVTFSNASPVAVTLPLEATVSWPAGTTLRLLNQGAGTVTVAGAVGVTINGTPLTLAQYKGAALIKTGTDTWTFAPFSSGVGAADFSNAATGSYSGYKYLTFTASGTITITTAGFADIVVCAGGGGGGNSGAGGAGGVLAPATTVYLPAGTLTVTVGAGGAKSTTGNVSRIDQYFAVGGGTCSPGNDPGYGGGSGGGAGSQAGAGGVGVATQGNNGGSAAAPAAGGGGGGGAAAVGADAAGSSGGNGGAGTTTSIAGTTPTGAYVAGNYALGGGGGGGGSAAGGTGGSGGGGDGAISTADGTDGAANTGGGGGSSYASTTRGRTGGSGIVIVRVAA